MKTTISNIVNPNSPFRTSFLKHYKNVKRIILVEKSSLPSIDWINMYSASGIIFFILIGSTLLQYKLWKENELFSLKVFVELYSAFSIICLLYLLYKILFKYEEIKEEVK